MVRLFFVSRARFGHAINPLTVSALLILGVVCGWTGQTVGQTLSLVWSDEFNGASLDLSKWTYDTGNGKTNGNVGWGNHELEFYTTNTANIYVTNGFLHIRAMIQDTNTWEGNFHYTSGRIKTQGLFNKTYGRIEWRASLPAGTGFWPALWALGTDIDSVGWPACGEIDVVENNGANPTFVQGSLHYSGGGPTATTSDTITNFHVYDLDWTNNSISWSVDGVVYETQTGWVGQTTAFNQPFFFLMNLAVGGDYLGDPSTNSIDPNMPGEMVIDYMRVYDYTSFVPTNPPAIPTGLVATPGGTSVGLTWNVASNATSYNVKRSLVNGGPYTTIANSGTTSYTDSGLASCSTYYYVVSGSNSIAESSNSTPATATIGPYSFAVNSGSTTAAGAFVADTDVSGGTIAAPTTATINTSGVTNPAPQGVYQTERYGTLFTYTFPGLTTGVTYTVRLHFCEYYWNGANQRKFNVFINGSQVLTNFDIYATAGGQDIALVREYSVAPKSNGQISIVYSNGTVDQAKASGIEIILPAPAAPTGLAATGGVAQVALSWDAVSGATGYNLSRSLVSNGPYTPVTNGITSTAYTDTGLADTTTYYYVVSTVKSGCESTNSVETFATTGTSLSPFEQWQTQYFGSTTNPAAAMDVDADGTGQNNLFKYVAGLDPTNPASVFVLNVTTVTETTLQINLFFNPVATGRTYTPQFSTDLVGNVWMPLTGYIGPTTNGNQIAIIDPNPMPSNEFYRIDISLP